jgi:hypothetical protein
MNVRFFRRVAAQMILQLRHFLCCERVQRESRAHRLGSKPPFAAPRIKVCYGPIVTEAAPFTYLSQQVVSNNPKWVLTFPAM